MNKESKKHLLPLQEQWIHFSLKETKHVFIYYYFLLFLSFLGLLFSLFYHYEIANKSFSVISGVFMFSFSSSVLGATIYYIRKLYKSCIQNLVTQENKKNYNEQYKKLGAKVYFYTRPLISGVISVIIHLGILAGLYIVQTQPDINDNRFFLFVAILSFYIGFSNGKIIIGIEKHSDSVVRMIFKDKENKNG